MKDDRLYLLHMLETSRRIEQKVAGLSRSQFDSDDNLQLALTHLIQTIGEAARLVGDSTRSTLPNIPWPAITGMRHRIVHDYTRIDLDVVWLVATQKIPELILLLAPTVDPIIAQANASQGKATP
jgi:uncharacterized protein with HEPN domain